MSLFDMFKDKATELLQGAKDQISELTGIELPTQGLTDQVGQAAGNLTDTSRQPHRHRRRRDQQRQEQAHRKLTPPPRARWVAPTRANREGPPSHRPLLTESGRPLWHRGLSMVLAVVDLVRARVAPGWRDSGSAARTLTACATSSAARRSAGSTSRRAFQNPSTCRHRSSARVRSCRAAHSHAFRARPRGVSGCRVGRVLCRRAVHRPGR